MRQLKCCVCGSVAPEDKFYKAKNKRGRQYACKACLRLKNKARYTEKHGKEERGPRFRPFPAEWEGLTDFSGKDLSKMDLQGRDFTGCNFMFADMRHACVARCNFYRANMNMAKLRFAHCGHANFTMAILQGADFYQADLTCCLFLQADIRNASFIEAKKYCTVFNEKDYKKYYEKA